MSYWGAGPDGCDFAFDSVSVHILQLKRRVMQEIETVLTKPYPEQSMITGLICLRLIGERFPKSFGVVFQRTDFEHIKKSFEEWYAKVSDKIPAKRRAGILKEATKEFALFERFIKKA